MLNEKDSYFFKGNTYHITKNPKINIHKPGQLIMEHFCPTLYYGRDNLSQCIDWTYRFNIIRFYRAIRSVIHYNRKMEKKGRKRALLDFNFKNISKLMRIKSKRKISPFRWRPIPMYRHIINKLGYNDLSIYDYDPRYGEKAIASANEGCEYYYNPTIPFDNYADDLADFLEYDFGIDEGYNYDVAIVDFDFNCDEYEEIAYYMDNYREKTDRLLIFIHNKFIDRFHDEYGGKDWLNVKTHVVESENGRWVKL
jgi:hypothetical protein